MSKNTTVYLIPSDVIEKKIYIIRGQKVMLDKDLAELYGVPTKRLNEQVKRNIKRFPFDFIFELTKEETKILRSQIATLGWGTYSKYQNYAFTEQGVAMLSSVLNSERAIQVNIQIMRTFTKIKQFIMGYKDLQQKIEKLEAKYDHNFKNVFEAIRLLIQNDKNIKKQVLLQERKKKNKKYGFQPGKSK